jgi:hypothetical protein
MTYQSLGTPRFTLTNAVISFQGHSLAQPFPRLWDGRDPGNVFTKPHFDKIAEVESCFVPDEGPETNLFQNP